MTTVTTTAAPTPEAAPRHLLTLAELGPGGLGSLLDLTRRLKRDPEAFRNRLAGGRIGMIFDKPSTRTRVSFESGPGKEAEGDSRTVAFTDFTVDRRLMERASVAAIFLHACRLTAATKSLTMSWTGPSHVSAANRLHTETALLYSLLTGDEHGARTA